MARLNAKQQLKGLIGPVYVRMLNGKQVVQTRPTNRKKSSGTSASGESFGLAVATSKAIRSALLPLLCLGTDSYVSQRLTGVLKKAFHQPAGSSTPLDFFTADLAGLVGFEFQKETPLERYMNLNLPFEITSDGRLQLPSTQIPAINSGLLPNAEAQCGLALMVVGWLPETGDSQTPEVFGFELESQGDTTIELQTNMYPTGTRLLVAAQLLSWKNLTVLGDKNYYNHKGFNPVAVVFTGVV